MLLVGVVLSAVFMFFLLLTCRALSKGDKTFSLFAVITSLAFGLLYGTTLGLIDVM